jgi:pentatricopeptide repeat protein
LPDGVTINTMTRAIVDSFKGDSRDESLLEQILASCRQFKVPNPLVHYNDVLERLSRRGCWPTMVLVLEQMRENDVARDVWTWRFMGRSAGCALYDSATGERLADKVLRDAATDLHRGQLAWVWFDAVTSACRHDHHRLAHYLVFEYFATYGLLLDDCWRSTLLERVMHACGRGQAPGLMRDTLMHSKAHGFKASKRMLELLIRYCHGRTGWALGGLDALIDHGYVPLTDGYAFAIRACATRHAFTVGLRLWQEMHDVGIRRDNRVYANTIYVCSRRGAWEDALRVLEAMKTDKDVPSGPDIRCYNFVVGGLAIAGKAELVRGMLQEMRRVGVTPTAVTYSWAVTGLAAFEGVDDAALRALVDEMDAANLGSSLRDSSEGRLALQRISSGASCVAADLVRAPDETCDEPRRMWSLH